MQRMKQKLNKWNETIQAEKLTDDPVELSFWVCKNLPLDDSQRLNILSIDNAVQRLRCALSVMEKVGVIYKSYVQGLDISVCLTMSKILPSL